MYFHLQYCYDVIERRQGVLTPALPYAPSPVSSVSHFFHLLVLRGFLAMKRVAV